MDEIGIKKSENDVQLNGVITEETKEEQQAREEPTGAVEDEKEAHDQAEMESLQDIQEEASKQLTDKERLVLYEKGIRLKRKGNARHALHCFLGCLQGLKERDSFSVLPECLHYIAEIYSEEEDYEVAIQFAQAEKLYYETALITVDREIKPESGEKNVSDSKDDLSDKSEDTSAQAQGAQDSDEAQKAEEYEKLAHMCLKQQNPQLALDYCAKAVKLQQSSYGEQHPVTLQTLDLFTVIYAEMGKQQYKAAMDKFSAAQEIEKEAKLSQKTAQTPKGEKKNEKNIPSASGSEDDVTKTKSLDEDQQPNTDTPSSTSQETVQLTLTSSWALALYLIITISIAVALTTALCYLTQTDIHTTFTYMTTRLRFYYYYYFQKAGSGGNQYF